MLKLMQFKRNSNLPTKQMELQADYLAGWYLGLRSRFIYTDPAFQAFLQMRDYEFNNPDHHGTPQQRLGAIQAGFWASGLSLEQAYQRSSELVRAFQ